MLSLAWTLPLPVTSSESAVVREAAYPEKVVREQGQGILFNICFSDSSPSLPSMTAFWACGIGLSIKTQRSFLTISRGRLGDLAQFVTKQSFWMRSSRQAIG